jgi:hypothetical protein
LGVVTLPNFVSKNSEFDASIKTLCLFLGVKSLYCSKKLIVKLKITTQIYFLSMILVHAAIRQLGKVIKRAGFIL